ncbi:Zn-dependent exopeptidase [Clavulina sp. PMI_390]|nr:Zn-dependent exopeptidase [Clavulina sp. PMI_390]
MASTLGRIVSLKTLTATVVTALFYIAIVVVTEWQDAPRTPPSSPVFKGVDLAQGFKDLKFIAATPHPYNSFRNDVVRDYILDSVNTVSANHKHVHVIDDLTSNATYSNGATTVYHESLNVVVLIEGTSPQLEHILLSAHFDSVSTGGGATDDGMGTATLMQLVNYFAEHPPLRSVVIFINNGEEDFLNGAQVFMEHPASKKIKAFLNLEGAGSGGRPLLFRTTNTEVTRYMKAASHPHGSTIVANAFKQGLIRSGTDYSVFEKAGIPGLDLAFYRHRNQYHTKYDSVSNMDGKGPLWNMLEASLEVAKALANDPKDVKGNSDAIYFDVLGEALVVLKLQSYFIINVVILTLGPISVLILGAFATRANKLYWTWHGWLRFPLALVLSVALEMVLIIGYNKVNPFIMYSSPRMVLLSFGSLTVIATWVVMKSFARFLPIPSQRQITLIEYYIFWWILLVLETVYIRRSNLSAFYPIIFFHLGALLALLLGFLEVLLFKPITPNANLPSDPDDPNVVTALVVERAEPSEFSATDDANETTPLLVTRRKVVGLKSEIYTEKQAGGMWAWQYLVIFPFQALLIGQCAYMMLFGLNGTLADGGSTMLMFILAAIFASLMVIPLTPFIHKLHWLFISFVALIFIASTAYNLLAFPFSPSEPLKVFFKQTIDLDKGTNRVYLEAVDKYLRHPIVDEIPSADKVWCSDKGIRPALRSCRYSGLLPLVAGSDTPLSELITWSGKRLSKTDFNTTVVRFRVKGEATRACRIYFESPPSPSLDSDANTDFVQSTLSSPSSADAPVAPRPMAFHVHGASHDGANQPNYPIPPTGAASIRLWSRTWNREWVVDADFGRVLDKGEKVQGRVACGWAENLDRRIPALEEVETFLPKWAAVTKADDGLVEAWYTFEI